MVSFCNVENWNVTICIPQAFDGRFTSGMRRMNDGKRFGFCCTQRCHIVRVQGDQLKVSKRYDHLKRKTGKTWTALPSLFLSSSTASDNTGYNLMMLSDRENNKGSSNCLLDWHFLIIPPVQNKNVAGTREWSNTSGEMPKSTLCGIAEAETTAHQSEDHRGTTAGEKGKISSGGRTKSQGNSQLIVNIRNITASASHSTYSTQ